MLSIGTKVRVNSNCRLKNAIGSTGTIIRFDRDDFDRLWIEVQFDNTFKQEGLHKDEINVATGEFQEGSLEVI